MSNGIKVKKIEFPSFEDWRARSKGFYGLQCDFIMQIGDYYLALEAVAWGKHEVVFACAVSTMSNPTNVYNRKVFYNSYICDTLAEDREEKLKEWYEKVTKEFNEFWQKYIIEKYCGE